MAVILRARKRPPGGPVDWRNLGTCPMRGYTLDERGLVDVLHPPPTVLSFNDLKMLINDVAGIEAKAMYVADNRLGGTFNQHLADFFEFIAPTLCLGVALFFGMVKAPRAYTSALPSSSILVNRYYGTRLNPQRLERMCQRHRVLFTATNSRFMIFTSFSFVLVYAGLMLIHKRIPKYSMFNDVTKEHVLYYNQTEASLKYLYAVYFHHPAYAARSATEHQLALPAKGRETAP